MRITNEARKAAAEFGSIFTIDDPWEPVYQAWFGSHVIQQWEGPSEAERSIFLNYIRTPTEYGGLGLTPNQALQQIQEYGGIPAFWYPEGKDFGDTLGDVGRALGKVAKAAAPFVAMIPGVGTVVGTAMYAVGSAAAGDRIDDIAISTVEQVLPENTRKAYRQAVDIGYGIARGQRIDDMALKLAREEAKNQGGDEAVAAFDIGIAAGKGRGLQDAGFRLMGAWVQGNDAGERAVIFAHDVTEAAQQGKSIGDFLIDEASAQFLHSVPAVQQALMLKKAIQYFLDHPELLKKRIIGDTEEDPKFDLNWEDLAEKAGVPVEAIRAAIICIQEMADGTLAEDPNKEKKILYPPIMRAMGWSDETTEKTSILFPTSETAAAKVTNDVYVKKAQEIENAGAAWLNPAGDAIRIVMIRRAHPDPDWQRGFDVAIGLCEGMSLPGPGQSAVMATLRNKAAEAGFIQGQTLQHERTKQIAQLVAKGDLTMAAVLGRRITNTLEQIQGLQAWAAQGRVEAAKNPIVATARALNADPQYKWGFDVGTGVAVGKTLPGPGQTAWRDCLGRSNGGEGGVVPGTLAAQQGFDTAQALQHGISKERYAQGWTFNGSWTPPSAANQAGALIANGLAGSGASADVKANAISSAAAHPDARAGAAQVVAKKTGFFHKVFAFLGFIDE